MNVNTIAAHTLGCKLNYAETSHLLQLFVRRGATVVPFDQKADIYLINTCTVTAIAEKKCRTAIRQAVRSNPQALVVVTGCYAQNDPEAVASIEGVNIVVGNNDKSRIVDLVDHYPSNDGKCLSVVEPFLSGNIAPLHSSGDRTRSFLKVQEGCDYFCTYCAIPFARGRSRSATIADCVEQAKAVAAEGVKEIVLTGVNTGTFGSANGESFAQLLQALDRVEPIQRYRISSIEPNLITDDIVHFVAHSRAFLPHFHIPIQAGSDKLLRLMHRRYTTCEYADKLQLIKRLLPDACIAADIMAGFNGEDDDEFERVCQFVNSLPISYLHVFTYSERPGTAALRLDGRIPMHQRRQHSARLHEISDHKKTEFYHSQMGKVRPVLWESTVHHYDSNPTIEGWTDNYVRFSRPYDASLVGQITYETISPANIVLDPDAD